MIEYINIKKSKNHAVGWLDYSYQQVYGENTVHSDDIVLVLYLELFLTSLSVAGRLPRAETLLSLPELTLHDTLNMIIIIE